MSDNKELDMASAVPSPGSHAAHEAVPSSPTVSIPDALFNYTYEQKFNIRMKLHPDCCQSAVCTFCGASEDNLLPCRGDLEGLALDLFEEAACCAGTANIKSIGQFVPWKLNDRQGRAFDAAARFVAAQGIAARSDETRPAAQPERQEPDPEGCAQSSPPLSPTPSKEPNP